MLALGGCRLRALRPVSHARVAQSAGASVTAIQCVDDVSSVETTVIPHPRTRDNEAQSTQRHERRDSRSVEGAQRAERGAGDDRQENETRADLLRRALIREARDELSERSREVGGREPVHAKTKYRRALNAQRHGIESEEGVRDVRGRVGRARSPTTRRTPR